MTNNDFSSGGDRLGIEFNIKDIEGAKIISFEEVVEKRMLSENISYDEALEIMLKEEEEIINEIIIW